MSFNLFDMPDPNAPVVVSGWVKWRERGPFNDKSAADGIPTLTNLQPDGFQYAAKVWELRRGYRLGKYPSGLPCILTPTCQQISISAAVCQGIACEVSAKSSH